MSALDVLTKISFDKKYLDNLKIDEEACNKLSKLIFKEAIIGQVLALSKTQETDDLLLKLLFEKEVIKSNGIRRIMASSSDYVLKSIAANPGTLQLHRNKSDDDEPEKNFTGTFLVLAALPERFMSDKNIVEGFKGLIDNTPWGSYHGEKYRPHHMFNGWSGSRTQLLFEKMPTDSVLKIIDNQYERIARSCIYHVRELSKIRSGWYDRFFIRDDLVDGFIQKTMSRFTVDQQAALLGDQRSFDFLMQEFRDASSMDILGAKSLIEKLPSNFNQKIQERKERLRELNM